MQQTKFNLMIGPTGEEQKTYIEIVKQYKIMIIIIFILFLFVFLYFLIHIHWIIFLEKKRTDCGKKQ